MCMDRQRIVDEVFYGLSAVPRSYVPGDHPLFNPDTPTYGFSIEAGSRLLEEVGWIDHDGDPSTPRIARGVPNVPDGTLLVFNYWTTEVNNRQQVVPILAESLALYGVHLNVAYFPAAEFFADPPKGQLFSRNFDMAHFAWLTGVDPLCELYITENIPGEPGLLNEVGQPRFPQGWQGDNKTGFSDPEYDQACRLAKSLLPGQPGYVESHLRAQEIFAREMPAIPLFQCIMVTAARADLCGYRLDPTANGDTWGIEEFGYGDECD